MDESLGNETAVTSSPITVVSKSNLNDFSRYLKSYIDRMKSSVEDSIVSMTEDEIDIAWGIEAPKKVRKIVEFEDLYPWNEDKIVYDYDDSFSRGYPVSLEITAEDVVGNFSTTEISYRAMYSRIARDTGEIDDSELEEVTGIVMSDDFGQNSSFINSRQVPIRLMLDGVEATTTITQSKKYDVANPEYVHLVHDDRLDGIIGSILYNDEYTYTQGWTINYIDGFDYDRYIPYTPIKKYSDGLIGYDYKGQGIPCEISYNAYIEISGVTEYYVLGNSVYCADENGDVVYDNTYYRGGQGNFYTTGDYDFEDNGYSYPDFVDTFGEELANRLFPESLRNEYGYISYATNLNPNETYMFYMSFGIYYSNSVDILELFTEPEYNLENILSKIEFIIPRTLEQVHEDMSDLLSKENI